MKYNYPVKWIKKVRFHWNKVRNRDIKENFILYFGENDVIINTKKALPRLKRINPKIKTRIIKNSGNSPYWDKQL